MLKLIALVGPTAAGKTALSIALAKKLNGEIISCDSMQVYRGMDIGTAKATVYERNIVPHHLIDVVDPDAIFSVADYQKLAKDKIIDITNRGKLPILVGGTGLYYQSVVDDYDFFPVEAKEEARQKWDKLCLDEGLAFLYEKLLEVDREYALKIGNNDKKRIIRALEVYELTGMPFSCLQLRKNNAYDLAAFGLYLERNLLYARIEERVDRMISEGLIEEVITLRDQGYNSSLNSMQALGYKQVYSYLEGLLSREDMLNEIKRETRRFAKRQYTWFNKDKRIQWLNVDEHNAVPDMVDNVCSTIKGQLFKM